MATVSNGLLDLTRHRDCYGNEATGIGTDWLVHESNGLRTDWPGTGVAGIEIVLDAG